MEKTKDLQGPPLDQHVLDLLGNPPLEQVATAMDDYNRDYAGGSILIEWEPRWVFRVPYVDVIDSMGDFARMSRPERRAIIGSINRSIAKLFPLVKARTGRGAVAGPRDPHRPRQAEPTLRPTPTAGDHR